MGAQGLLAALRSHATLRPVRLTHQAAEGAASPAPAAGRVVVVDASSAMHQIAEQLGLERIGVSAPGDVHGEMKAATCAFCARLQRAGLRVVCVIDSCLAPGDAAQHCARRAARVAEGRVFSPAVSASDTALLQPH